MRFDGMDAVMIAYFAMIAAICLAGAWSLSAHYWADAHALAACLEAGNPPESCKEM